MEDAKEKIQRLLAEVQQGSGDAAFHLMCLCEDQGYQKLTGEPEAEIKPRLEQLVRDNIARLRELAWQPTAYRAAVEKYHDWLGFLELVEAANEIAQRLYGAPVVSGFGSYAAAVKEFTPRLRTLREQDPARCSGT